MRTITQLLDEFHTDARRLESLQHYSEPAEQLLFRKYCVGEPIQPLTSSEWSSFVRAKKYGRRFRRIRLVIEPLTTYTKFELEWLYTPNVDAGEEIRIAPLDKAFEGPDFWIFDEGTLARLHYSEDGALIRVEPTVDATEVRDALEQYAYYESRSVDLRTYLMHMRNAKR